jgi:hypothetical protein
MKRVVFTLVLGALAGCTCAQLPDALFLCEEDGSCAQPGFVCGADQVCRRPSAPADAGCGDVTTSAANCGACGVACASGSCVGGRCACSDDTQCRSGSLCAPTGLCTPSGDPCVNVHCPPTQVCRPGTGTCAPVNCADGCLPGEVCDGVTLTCRVLACRLPVACDGGTCAGPARPDGTPCDDAVACTAGDQCVAGDCVGTAYSCPASTACADDVACAGDGGCAGTPKADGTACDDGEACTWGDQCAGGACSGTSYSCPAASACQSSVQCLGDGGCLGTPMNEGGACDDGVACTANDTCTSGACTGAAYTCPAPTACQQAVACAGDGGCLVTDKMNGDSCDDGVACTANDTCQAGVCSGTPGTSYRDLDGDGRGDSNVASTGCPAPMNYVGVGGDCNDNDPGVFQAVMGLVTDLDGDGYSTGTANVQCVGAQVTLSGRTAYQDAAGNPAWLLASDALGTDCNDAAPTLYQSVANLVTDVDRDGRTVGTPATQCVGASTLVSGRTYYLAAGGASTWLAVGESLGTDCDDANVNVFVPVASLVTDADQDGYGIGTAATECVGATSSVGGRTYHAGATGLFTWLPSSAALGTDCNDANATVSGPTTWYLDGDGDTRGGSTTQVACSAPANHVATTGDCDDTDADLYETVASLVTDVDGDGYSVGAAASQCVGGTSLVSGRTYYLAAGGAYSWLSSTASLGTDCDDAVAAVFQNVNSLLADADRDGYPLNDSPGAQCVGAVTTVGGRTYYAGAGSPAYWMPQADCIDRQGSNCPSLDCYDTNEHARPDQLTYFGTQRGDGSFDYDCSGAATTLQAGTWCSVSASLQTFSDSGCLTDSGTRTVCTSTATVSLPAACGGYLVSGSTFYNPGTCTAVSLPGTTQVLCR